MTICYASRPADNQVRHLTNDGSVTLCGATAAETVSLPLPVNCDLCRTINGHRIRAAMNASPRPTAITVAMNLRHYMYTACRYSLYNTYPRGEGTPPELAPYTDAERGKQGRTLAHYAAQLRELYPAVYERWQAACVAAQDAVDPTTFV